MKIDKNINKVIATNLDIKRIMSGGGILWEANTVPGPTKLIGGNSQAGFYGEVPTRSFITGDELAAKIGLTAGVSQFSNDAWLKFSYLGNIEFIAKKPFRHSISWNDINVVNAIYGNRIINIKGNNYKIRLMKGKNEGNQSDQTYFEGHIVRNSEWNRLMLPIHQNAPSNWRWPGNVNLPTEKWNVRYTDFDLMVNQSEKNGSFSWCQERGSSYNFHLGRGSFGVSNSGNNSSINATPYSGWRPVLELIGEINQALEAKEKLQIQFGNGTWFNGDGVASNIGRDIRTIPTAVEGYKVTISWKSSNLNIMTNDGKRVGKGDVSLIATIRDDNGYTETKEFKLIII